MTFNLLEIRNVTKVFTRGLISRDRVIAVENVSLKLASDEPRIVALAGESGSGKSTLGLMVLGFLRPDKGNILYKGQDIDGPNGGPYPTFRREVQAVFQNPFEAYNPFYKVDHVFQTAIRKFKLATGREETRKITEEALEVVRLNPATTLGRYPHQLSGGQLQRIMLARAFLLKPRLIVADEPVSMIDASLRAIVLDIMIGLKEEFGISQLYITHDLSTALQISDDILIMYQGNIVERGVVESVIQAPQHPYTQLLVNSIPSPDPADKWEKPLELEVQNTTVGSGHSGCKFYARCPHRMDICLEAFPSLYRVGPNQEAACYLYQNDQKQPIAAG